MKIVCIGAGPAALYFAILMKKSFPQTDIRVFEAQKRHETYGWGLLMCAANLRMCYEMDPRSGAAMLGDVTSWQRCLLDCSGTWLTFPMAESAFGIARHRFVGILRERCRELGVSLEYERQVQSLDEFQDADLILAADGRNSFVRELHRTHFRPSRDPRKCRFCWLGARLPMDSFKMLFKKTEHGVFQAHAYPTDQTTSTWIIECREETWRKAGLDKASEQDTLEYCEQLFAEHLLGQRLLSNRSIWRSFVAVSCQTWSHQNVLLLGDAAHPVHFSIGSGTLLAIGDAVTLVNVFRHQGSGDVQTAIQLYESARRPVVREYEKWSRKSLQWFEDAAQHLDRDPLEFASRLMNRTL